MIFGCPNNPEEQPFEFTNAHCKRHVKRTCRKGRTFSQLKQNIFDGWYGRKTILGRNHEEVNENLISGWRRKCENKMTQKIQKRYGEDKTIFNLWTEESSIRLDTPFTRPPYTKQTEKRGKKCFELIYNNKLL